MIFKKLLNNFIVSVLSLVTIYNSIFTNKLDSRYDLLFFVPLSFLFALLANYKISRYYKDNLVVTIIFVTYFIRNVIAIYLLSISDYFSIIDKFSKDDMRKAIMIMSIDVIFVFSYLNYHMKYYSIYYKKKLINFYELLNNKNSKLFKIIISIIIILICFSWTAVYEIRDNYVTIFDFNVAELSSVETNEKIDRGGFERVMLTLSLLFIKIIRILFPIFFFVWFKLKIKYLFVRFLLFSTLMFLQFLLIPSQTMDVVLVILVLFLVFLKIEDNNRIILNIGFISLLFILSFFSYLKIEVESEATLFLSTFFQAYFPGVYNLANVFTIQTDISKLDSLFSDFYSMIPFRHSIFPIDVSMNTNEIYNSGNTIKGQIIPLIGEAFYYLGFLAFLIPILIIKCAFYFYRKANSTTNIFEFTIYIYITIFFTISPILYHDTIIGAFFFITALPLLLLLRLNKLFFKKYT